MLARVDQRHGVSCFPVALVHSAGRMSGYGSSVLTKSTRYQRARPDAARRNALRVTQTCEIVDQGPQDVSCLPLELVQAVGRTSGSESFTLFFAYSRSAGGKQLGVFRHGYVVSLFNL